MKVGSTYRLRLINITADNANIDVTLSKDAQPISWRAIAKDGADLPPAQTLESKAERQSLTTGETRDFEMQSTEAALARIKTYLPLIARSRVRAILKNRTSRQ